MLSLVLTLLVAGAFSAPTPQLIIHTQSQDGATRLVPLVIQNPDAAPGTFVPVVVAAPETLKQDTVDDSSPVAEQSVTAEENVHSSLNKEPLSIVSLNTKTLTDSVVDILPEQNEERIAKSIGVDAVSEVIEAVEVAAQIAAEKDIADIVADAEIVQQVATVLEEHVSEAVVAERAIEQKIENVVASAQAKGVITEKEVDEIVAAEQTIEVIDEAISKNILEASVIEQAAENEIKEKVADVVTIAETKENIENVVLQGKNTETVIEISTEPKGQNTQLDELEQNESSGKSISSVSDQHKEQDIPLPNALSAVMAMITQAVGGQDEEVVVESSIVEEPVPKEIILGEKEIKIIDAVQSVNTELPEQVEEESLSIQTSFADNTEEHTQLVDKSVVTESILEQEIQTVDLVETPTINAAEIPSTLKEEGVIAVELKEAQQESITVTEASIAQGKSLTSEQELHSSNQNVETESSVNVTPQQQIVVIIPEEAFTQQIIDTIVNKDSLTTSAIEEETVQNAPITEVAPEVTERKNVIEKQIEQSSPVSEPSTTIETVETKASPIAETSSTSITSSSSSGSIAVEVALGSSTPVVAASKPKPSEISTTTKAPRTAVTPAKQIPLPAQQNLIIDGKGKAIFETSVFGSSVSPTNFIIGRPVRVPQTVIFNAGPPAPIPATVDPKTLVDPRFHQFIFDNDSPDVIAAKVNFFRIRAATIGAPVSVPVSQTSTRSNAAKSLDSAHVATTSIVEDNTSTKEADTPAEKKATDKVQFVAEEGQIVTEKNTKTAKEASLHEEAATPVVLAAEKIEAVVAEEAVVVEEPAVDEIFVVEETIADKNVNAAKVVAIEAENDVADEVVAVEEAIKVENTVADEAVAVEKVIDAEKAVAAEVVAVEKAIESENAVAEEVVAVEKSIAAKEVAAGEEVPAEELNVAEEVPVEETIVVEEVLVEEAVAAKEVLVEETVAAEEVLVEETAAAEEVLVEEAAAAEEVLVEEAAAAEEVLVEEAAAAEETPAEEISEPSASA